MKIKVDLEYHNSERQIEQGFVASSKTKKWHIDKARVAKITSDAIQKGELGFKILFLFLLCGSSISQSSGAFNVVHFCFICI